MLASVDNVQAVVIFVLAITALWLLLGLIKAWMLAQIDHIEAQEFWSEVSRGPLEILDVFESWLIMNRDDDDNDRPRIV